MRGRTSDLPDNVPDSRIYFEDLMNLKLNFGYGRWPG